MRETHLLKCPDNHPLFQREQKLADTYVPCEINTGEIIMRTLTNHKIIMPTIILFIAAQKNVIYIRSAAPGFVRIFLQLENIIVARSARAYKCFHYFGAAARGFKSTNFWYSAEFIRVVRQLYVEVFFSPVRETSVRRSKIRNPPAAVQSVSIKANGIRRYFAFYQEHRICIVRSAGLRASPLSRAGKK